MIWCYRIREWLVGLGPDLIAYYALCLAAGVVQLVSTLRRLG